MHVKSSGLNRTWRHVRKHAFARTTLKGCCRRCQGDTDDHDFEDVSPTASWTGTMRENNILPWQEQGPWYRLLHDNEDPADLLKFDIFHVYGSGFGQHVGASTLVLTMGFLDASVPTQLDRLNEHLKAWQKLNPGNSLKFVRFTRDLLGFNSTADYPDGGWSKIRDTVIVVQFAEWLCTTHMNSERCGDYWPLVAEASLLCRTISKFSSMVYEEDLFIYNPAAMNIINVGYTILKAYSNCAYIAKSKWLCLYQVQPKLHYFHHIVDDMCTMLKRAGCCMNPLATATPQNEDVVGRTSRLSRRVASKKTELRCLKGYLAAAHEALANDDCFEKED